MASAAYKTALVTGATGVIGPVLVQKLAANGYDVRVLARRPVARDMLPANVTVVLGDITDGAAVAAAVSGIDYIFHLAAKLHINNPSPELYEEYRRVNVEGTRLIVEAARTALVKRLVFFSSIAVYGATHAGEVLDEDSPVRADTMYGATKREAELLVLAQRRTDGQPLGVVLRIAGVYGSRIKGNYRELVRWLHRGMFVSVGSGANRRTLVYDRDVAQAAILAAEHPSAAGHVFNVTDGAIHTFDEIVHAITHAMHRRSLRMRVPHAAARTAAGLADSALRFGGRPPVARALVDKLTEDLAVSGTRIQERLGFRPQFDLSKGWRDTIPAIVSK